MIEKRQLTPSVANRDASGYGGFGSVQQECCCIVEATWEKKATPRVCVAIVLPRTFIYSSICRTLESAPITTRDTPP